MKILFSNPPWWSVEPVAGRPGTGSLIQGVRAGSRWPFTRPASHRPDAFEFGNYLPYPFFLGSAAGYVARAFPAANVIMRDSIARGESYESFYRAINWLKPDYVVIETGAAAWEHDRGVCKAIKGFSPNTKIAIAGPTAKMASETETSGLVDAYILGEYEKGSVEFVGGARGLIPFSLLTTEEMNTLPFPRFDEPCALNYWDACPKGQIAPHLQMFTSRGCPYKCCFCAWPATMTGQDPDGTQKRSVRFHSKEWVRDFIRDFTARHPDVRSVMFDDDTMNLSAKHVAGICEVMREIKLPWSAMCRADTIDREHWSEMAASGCFGVKLGFESGVQRVVDEIVNKRLNLVEAEETAKFLKQIGMTVHGTFTIGLPGETKDEAEQTKKYVARLMSEGTLDTFQLSGTATIENTPLDRIAKGEALKVYPGAKAEGFVRDHDGNKKVAEMQATA